MQYLSQHSYHVDRRHLITLSWIVTGVLLSQSLHLTEWEPFVVFVVFVVSRATQAHGYQKRWGGLGGLACAIALRKQGIKVRVYEQAKDFRLGGGLALFPNGLNFLELI